MESNVYGVFPFLVCSVFIRDMCDDNDTKSWLEWVAGLLFSRYLEFTSHQKKLFEYFKR
jgi:hypothetical protein